MQKYSNVDDCKKLAIYLKNKLNDKIDFCGNTHERVVCGKYLGDSYKAQSSLSSLNKIGLPFYYKFCENEFLQIKIGSLPFFKNSLGEKLAVLSIFYEVLKEKFGEPLVFYTSNDDEQSINLQWSFINKEEEIEAFKNGTYFDDGEIDELIIFGEQKVNAIGYQIGETARENNTRIIGLPFDLFPLVEENMEDYVKYKKGKPIGIPEGARMDSTPVALYENKITLEKTI